MNSRWHLTLSIEADSRAELLAMLDRAKLKIASGRVRKTIMSVNGADMQFDMSWPPDAAAVEGDAAEPQMRS